MTGMSILGSVLTVCIVLLFRLPTITGERRQPPLANSIQAGSAQRLNDHHHHPRAWPFTTSSTRGLQIKRSSCPPKTAIVLDNAVESTKELLRAGRSALESKSEDGGALFNWFFFAHERPMVNKLLRNIYDRLNAIGPTVTFKCPNTIEDFQTCAQNDFVAFIAIYAQAAHRRTATITACPLFLGKPSLPDPCDKAFLLQNDESEGKAHATTLLHEMLHLPYIAGEDVWYLADNDFATSVLSHLIRAYPEEYDTDGVKPSTNLHSYMHFVQWAWMRQEQKTKCPSVYPLWNEVKPAVGDEPVDHNELRHLLQDAGPVKDDVVLCPNATFVGECKELVTAENSTVTEGDLSTFTLGVDNP